MVSTPPDTVVPVVAPPFSTTSLPPSTTVTLAVP